MHPRVEESRLRCCPASIFKECKSQSIVLYPSSLSRSDTVKRKRAKNTSRAGNPPTRTESFSLFSLTSTQTFWVVFFSHRVVDRFVVFLFFFFLPRRLLVLCSWLLSLICIFDCSAESLASPLCTRRPFVSTQSSIHLVSRGDCEQTYWLCSAISLKRSRACICRLVCVYPGGGGGGRGDEGESLCFFSLSPSFCLSVRVDVCLCILHSAPFNLSLLRGSPVSFHCLNPSPLPDYLSINLP